MTIPLVDRCSPNGTEWLWYAAAVAPRAEVLFRQPGVLILEDHGVVFVWTDERDDTASARAIDALASVAPDCIDGQVLEDSLLPEDTFVWFYVRPA